MENGLNSDLNVNFNLTNALNVNLNADLIESVFAMSDEISKYQCRFVPNILTKSFEEVGELATEVGIVYHGFYKQPGADGIVGEAIDVILCMLDIIHIQYPDMTVEQVKQIAAYKLQKWKNKTSSSLMA